MRTFLFLFTLFLISSCAKEEFIFSQGMPPVEQTFKQDQQPQFAEDDMDRNSLLSCARQQFSWVKKQPAGKTFPLNGKTVSRTILLDSLSLLLNKLEENPTPDELEDFIANKFKMYRAAGRQQIETTGKMLVTGYYEPIFTASLERTRTFQYPIYALPKNLTTTTSNTGTKVVGRYNKKGQFVKFWSREEIEKKGVLKGAELAYLTDPFDVFLLHVQGSGKLQFPDGSIRAVRFAGTNGREYKSIGKFFVDKNIMTLEDVNIPAIRSYLEEHPEERDQILFHNPRYVFFSWGKSTSTRGSSQLPLTPGRSVAIDNSALPPGSIGFLASTKPVVNQNGEITGWKPFCRFVFPQDTGSAIKGTGRVDIFWGSGRYAETAANYMKQDGALYFLIKK